MLLLQILPVIIYVGAVVVILAVAAGREASASFRWMLPAGIVALFIAFSAITIAQEGPMQFWVNHTTTLAGNQVWFDLIFAVSAGFYLIAPRARAVGMPLTPWAIAVIATACIALLIMLARVIWLEQKTWGQT